MTTAVSDDNHHRTYRWDLDVLRIMAILGVLAIHIFGLILGEERLRGTPTWSFAVIVDIGSTWCVPVFVMISGALLLSPRAHVGGPGVFLRKRALRLLPALVVWHLVYLLLVRRAIQSDRPTVEAVLVQLIDGRIYTALYFLWLILGLYLVAPVLAAFLAEGGQRRAAVTAVVASAWTAVILALPGITTELGSPRPRGDNIVIMFLPYIGLFVAGYAWREPQRHGWRWLWTGAVAVVLLAESIWQYDVRPDHTWLQALSPVAYFSPLITIASVCLFVCVIDLCSRIDLPDRAQRVLRTLGAATFGVFLCHLVFVAVFRRWYPDFYADPRPIAKIQMYLAVVVLAFSVSIIARKVPVLRRVF
ncbi:acyltransferase [Pimelobacter simplex]|uniref:acyltransferase n=1 Tax=Nocardioides simplex TaxID=2045 RepID=UPI00214FAC1D|nr:acyltransferase [Pimelobacter simplex]UUW91634.1 acyltransferase [Pimelobacter simplex]UUW95462.1 acyltransferase [Pimelobacter simplex]